MSHRPPSCRDKTRSRASSRRSWAKSRRWRAHNDALWRAHTTGDPAHQEQSVQLDTRIRGLLSRRELYEQLCRLGLWRDHRSTPRSTARVTPQDHRANQIDPDQIAAMVSPRKSPWRADSTASAPRWMAEPRLTTSCAGCCGSRSTGRCGGAPGRPRSRSATKLLPDLLELVRRRNLAARSLGFDNFYTMMLELDELDEPTLFKLLDDLERGTSASFAAYKRELDEERARAFGVAIEDSATLALPGSVLPARGCSDSTSIAISKGNASTRWPRLSSERWASTSTSCWGAPTSSSAPGRISTPSARRSIAAPTCGFSATSARTSTGWDRCSTSSGTRCTSSTRSRAALSAARARAHSW